jgi:hypothetical protein
MRRAGRAAALGIPWILCILLAAGCGTIRLEVPPDHSVRLLEEDEPAQIHVERTVWFWLFGARPISDNTTLPEIERYDLCEIRMQTVQSMADQLTNLVTVFVTIVRRTLVVEGNAPPGCTGDTPSGR